MFYRNLFYNFVYELNPPMTEVMQSIISFHGYLWVFLLFIAIFVFVLFSQIIYSMLFYKKYLAFIIVCYTYLELLFLEFDIYLDITTELKEAEQSSVKYYNRPAVNHYPILEFIWTLVPSIILFFIAIPSFSLLYSADEPIDSVMSTKVIGYQWYWAYEYPALKHIYQTEKMLLLKQILALSLLLQDNPHFLRP